MAASLRVPSTLLVAAFGACMGESDVAGFLQRDGNPSPSSGGDFGRDGGAPKNCHGYMKDNSVDWSGGFATITNYNAGSAGAGAFGQNFGMDRTSRGGAYGAAYASSAMSTSNYYPGLCDDGISAGWGKMPLVGGQALCFELTGLQTGQSIKVQVTENCGGNCFKNAGISCDSSQECNSIGLQNPYDKSHRCSAAQECQFPGEFTLGYNDDMTLPAQTCNRKFHDWCSGVYAHLDLGMSPTNKDYKKLCPDGGNCVVMKARIPCPSWP